jgi:hypothetical protein
LWRRRPPISSTCRRYTACANGWSASALASINHIRAFLLERGIAVRQGQRFLRMELQETLGLKSGSAGNQGDNWWVEYDLPGGGCLALTNFTKEKPSDTAGGTIAFEVEDLDRLMTAQA